MTGLRVAHRLACEPSSAPCARCLTVDVAAGEWYADGLEGPICDRCAQRDDPRGVEAFRRMARPTAGGGP